MVKASVAKAANTPDEAHTSGRPHGSHKSGEMALSTSKFAGRRARLARQGSSRETITGPINSIERVKNSAPSRRCWHSDRSSAQMLARGQSDIDQPSSIRAGAWSMDKKTFCFKPTARLAPALTRAALEARSPAPAHPCRA